MSVTQTVEIPASRRITLDVPREVPVGTVVLTFTPAETERIKERVFGCAKGQFHMAEDFDAPLEDVRRLLQKEMAEKGTSAVTAASGDGWEAHVMEHYAEP